MPSPTQDDAQLLASWMHVSDIHFGHGSAAHQWDQKLITSAIRRDILESVRDRLVPRVNYVFVTGDIAFSGGGRTPTAGSSEYDLAREWLDGLVGDLNLGREHVFLVPGNHDVNRRADEDRDTLRLLRAARDGSERLDELLRHQAEVTRLAGRMSGFQNLAKLFGPSSRRTFVGAFWWNHVIALAEGVFLRLCGLNTALLCADDRDQGRLLVGNQQLADNLVPPPREHEIIVVLSHHPFTGKWLRDEQSVRARFDREVGLHLFGHIHETDSEQARHGWGTGCVRIAAGAAHSEESSPDRPPIGHGYNVGALVLLPNGELAVRVWPRRWSSKSSRFVADSDNIDERKGYAEHSLPLRIPRPATSRPPREPTGALAPVDEPARSTRHKHGDVDQMTAEELAGAMATVLKSAGYKVRFDRSFSGSDTALCAERSGVGLPEILCIESAVYRIDNAIYGQILARLTEIRDRDPEIRCIVVSTSGFASDAFERAAKQRIRCWTYSEFRRHFIATAAYEELVVGPDDPVISAAPRDPNSELALWQQVRDLERVYQDPELLVTSRGSVEKVQSSLAWFDLWIQDPTRRWVSLIGDYGSGKTALTKMLLLRWMRAFRQTGEILPIRIELRDFAMKFDYEGLLIHFWRKHALDAMPLATFEMLISEGRAVFILDGFDEMAQNLTLVDRRNCLTALTKAISGRSPGIITSRPNYFTEAEELHVVEMLYRRTGTIQRLDQPMALEEEKVDSLLQRYYLDRQDAQLQELEPEQVDKLLSVWLVKEPQLLRNVKDIIHGIYGLDHSSGQPNERLASKPVIITYLLDVAENLDSLSLTNYRPLNDWGLYRLIMDKLVYRDQGRTSGIVLPSERRRFLQDLAIVLSVRRLPYADRRLMLKHVDELFGRAIRRHADVGSKEEQYFADLRSSASLTSKNEMWYFSHASLREFLVAEFAIESVLAGGDLSQLAGLVPSSGMVKFLAASFDHFADLMGYVAIASKKFPEIVLGLFIPAILARGTDERQPLLAQLVPDRRVSGVLISGANFQDVTFSEWNFEDVMFERCTFKGCAFLRCSIVRSEFSDCSMVGVTFEGGDFARGAFDGVAIERCSMDGLEIRKETKVLLRVKDEMLIDDRGRAYLRFIKADIAPGQKLNVWQFSRRWPDFDKVMQQLLEGDRAFRQYLGLTQRGVIQDTAWTRDLVDMLVNRGVLEQNEHKAVRVLHSRLTDAHEMREGDLPDYLVRLLSR